MNQSYFNFQLWSVIEQVLETDFMISATDEEKLPGNIKPVGQKVFLERRPEGDYEDKVNSDNQSAVDKYKPYSPPGGESQASDFPIRSLDSDGHNPHIFSTLQAETQYCDLDDYLQRELEKLQQEPNSECGEQNLANRDDKGSYDQGQTLSGDSLAGGEKKTKVKTKSASASACKENKKIFTCTFDGCRKHYVKSSHLKVS